MTRPFRQLDVFATGPCSGNPLAVVLDAEGLTTEQMARFAEWTNLSETTFVLPPTDDGADYRVRIFNLARELPFAGHPTLGTCQAWLEVGGQPRDPRVVVQECGVGLVPVRRDGDELAFAAPPLVRSGPLDDATIERVVAVLGVDRDELVDAAWVDNGPGWIGVLLGDADRVLALEPDVGRDPGEGALDVGVAAPHTSGSPFALEVRAFFSDEQGALREDPVTGSLNASLGQWLLASGRVQAPYLARQGTRLGREGRVRVTRDDDGVWVGGLTRTVLRGEADL